MALRRAKARKKSGKVTGGNETVPGSCMDKRPKFSFEHLNGQYCLSHCIQEEKAAFADKLHRLSQMPWNEIFNADRHKMGCEKIPYNQLSGISERFSDEKFLVFRFSGMKSMIGFRHEDVFYVIALDRDFTCYRH